MQATEPLVGQIVEQPVVLGGGLPAHAAEEPDQTHPPTLSERERPLRLGATCRPAAMWAKVTGIATEIIALTGWATAQV
ncbi:hypothetical protein Aca07nite_85650 [Actinoplanes capillaceus]|uniref:Uncharacterized protein n=1 Tax=Actinoplanes campanulatus TaxID=113559 RepID=A0ABQ3WYF0_9ACTN|nr:hypothetical protein Aca07nite_85650 [Actinoplanes capillaceus]